MKICVAGAYGAFGLKHLDALRNIEDIEVSAVMGPNKSKIEALAKERGIPRCFTELKECLEGDIDALILATPTHLHAGQAIACMDAGKHILIEIPMADSLEDSKRIIQKHRETGLTCMAGHVRRFNPSHQWIRNKITAGDLKLQQLDVQTYFFRRTNTNAKGEPRSWTDHLLWHHACHTVDLFQYQTGGGKAVQAYGLQGPINPELGIAMDMSIGMKAQNGAICTLSLSFNNDGPFGTFFRYICDKGTFLARYDDLFDGNNNQIDLSGVALSNNGIELIDREFFLAVRQGRKPNSCVTDVVSAMETLDHINNGFKHGC
jgi:2-hydroxy-4-carboxymuconate semialdehyde hemiacetal dehydrogenase